MIEGMFFSRENNWEKLSRTSSMHKKWYKLLIIVTITEGRKTLFAPAPKKISNLQEKKAKKFSQLICVW